VPWPDEHDDESADDKSSTHGDGAIVVGTLVPWDVGMALLAVAQPALIVVAASLIEAGADREPFRDSRPECDKSSGKRDRHSQKPKQVETSGHRLRMPASAFLHLPSGVSLKVRR